MLMKTYQRVVVSISIGFAILSLAWTAQAGTAAYRSVVLADNPVVYYEFDETSGTTATNSGSSSAVNDGTIVSTVTVGQPSFAQGGTAYDFGGGRVTAAAFSTMTEWTVEAWINWDQAKTSQSHIFGNDQGGWNDDVLFGIGAETGGVGVPASNVGCTQQGSPGETRDFVTQPLGSNEWHHVVVTGSTTDGELKLYVDGVLVDTDSSLVNGVTMNGHQFAVGAARYVADAGTRPFDGLIDEFALYDSALDATTINAHYEAGLGYRDTVLADSPIVYYEFNEISGTTAFNSGSLGSSHNGTLVGTVSLNKSSFAQGGTAYDFGGGRVTAAAFSPMTEWTVEAWINWDSAKTSQSHIFGNDQGGWNDDVLFGIGADATSYVPASNVGCTQQSADQSTTRDIVKQALPHSEWHHVVATGSDSAGELKLYVDGVLVDTDASLTLDATMNGHQFAVGAARYVADAGTRPFDGLIDEFALYDSVLDAATIRDHYDAGVPTTYREAVLVDCPLIYYEFDETSGTSATNSGTLGASHNGTIASTVTLNQEAFLTGSTCYDFGGGYVSATALTSSLTEWTVEAWINWDSARTFRSTVFSNDRSGWNNDVMLGISPEGTSVTPANELAVIHQTTSEARDIVKVNLSANTWHHVIATGSTTDGELKLYVDGVLVGTDIMASNMTLDSADLWVGRRNATGNQFDGLIDEFALYDRVLSVGTIKAHYGWHPPLGTVFRFR
jgi:hypothetical protein